jgi:predicted PurR-regulated permease PerM
VPESEESVVAHYVRATLGVALVAGALAAAWVARQVLILVLISLVLAIGFDPGVHWVTRRLKVRRGLAVAVILFSAVAVLGIFLALVIPPIVNEVQDLARDLPRYTEKLKSSRGPLGDLQKRFDLAKRLEDLSRDLPRLASSSFGTILSFGRSVAGGVFSFLTIVVLTTYFMGSMPRLKDGVASLFPVQDRSRYRELLEEATDKIGGYVSGQATVSAIAGVTSFIAFLVIGVPFPAALALLVAITGLIPSVGALIGAVISTAVAAFAGSGPALLTLIYMVIYQQVENYLISPRIMKKAVDLSPAAVIVSVLIGGALLGFVGVLLALPLAASAKVVVRDLWLGPRIEKVREARQADSPPPRKRRGRARAAASSESKEKAESKEKVQSKDKAESK